MKPYLKHKKGFSLAEVLCALTIGVMVMIVVLKVYSRAQQSAAAINKSLGAGRVPYEILQLIAEDIDKIITSGSQSKITVDNKFDTGFATARLIILKTFYNDEDKKETFEEIIWQTAYDSRTGTLAIYRSRSGLAGEDKLLDSKKQDWEREMFVPVCAGITFFQIQVRTGTYLDNKWIADVLPDGIVITISTAQPVKTPAGTLDVPDSEKITRTIAVDRTRKLKFVLPPKQPELEI